MRSPGTATCASCRCPTTSGTAIDGQLPPRWSRSNPVDCAGGETRDTIPEVMALVAGHPDVDAVVYLGLGIQSNQARLMRDGPFYPDHGLERIVAYHERQDARFAEAAAEISDVDRQAHPHRHRAGRGRSGQPRPGHGPGVRAALLPVRPTEPSPRSGHLYRYARWRERRGLRRSIDHERADRGRRRSGRPPPAPRRDVRGAVPRR